MRGRRLRPLRPRRPLRGAARELWAALFSKSGCRRGRGRHRRDRRAAREPAIQVISILLQPVHGELSHEQQGTRDCGIISASIFVLVAARHRRSPGPGPACVFLISPAKAHIPPKTCRRPTLRDAPAPGSDGRRYRQQYGVRFPGQIQAARPWQRLTRAVARLKGSVDAAFPDCGDEGKVASSTVLGIFCQTRPTHRGAQMRSFTQPSVGSSVRQGSTRTNESVFHRDVVVATVCSWAKRPAQDTMRVGPPAIDETPRQQRR